MLVRVDKFVFSVDFVILDFEQYRNCPLILRRPFLNTGKALIDVCEGKIILRVGEEKVEFIMNKLIQDFEITKLYMEVEAIERQRASEATPTPSKKQRIKRDEPSPSQDYHMTKKAKKR